MKTWSIFDEYFKNDKSFNYKTLSNSILESNTIEQIDEHERKKAIINYQNLSQSQISVINPTPKPSEYFAITGEIQWDQSFIKELILDEQQNPIISPSIWHGNSSVLYRSTSLQAANIGISVPINTNVKNNQNLSIEIIQRFNELNIETEEDEILTKEKLTSWFERNGENGVRAVWELPSEITASGIRCLSC
jgi:hypothetical protein